MEGSIDIEQDLSEEEMRKLTNDQIIHFIFNKKYIYADIYWCFERTMSLGMRNLYLVPKPLSVMKAEIIIELKKVFPFEKPGQKKASDTGRSKSVHDK